MTFFASILLQIRAISSDNAFQITELSGLEFLAVFLWNKRHGLPLRDSNGNTIYFDSRSNTKCGNCHLIRIRSISFSLYSENDCLLSRRSRERPDNAQNCRHGTLSFSDTKLRSDVEWVFGGFPRMPMLEPRKHALKVHVILDAWNTTSLKR